MKGYFNEENTVEQMIFDTLYDISISAMNQHLKHIFENDELEREATIKHCLIVQNEGGRRVQMAKTITLDFTIPKQNISLHIKNIFEDRELIENSVVKESLTTASDGNLEVLGKKLTKQDGSNNE